MADNVVWQKLVRYTLKLYPAVYKCYFGFHVIDRITDCHYYWGMIMLIQYISTEIIIPILAAVVLPG